MNFPSSSHRGCGGGLSPIHGRTKSVGCCIDDYIWREKWEEGERRVREGEERRVREGEERRVREGEKRRVREGEERRVRKRRVREGEERRVRKRSLQAKYTGVDTRYTGVYTSQITTGYYTQYTSILEYTS